MITLFDNVSFTLLEMVSDTDMDLQIPVLTEVRNRDLSSESVQCEHVLHSVMSPSDLESESESVPESISSNVYEP